MTTTGKRRKKWSVIKGARGYTVTACERAVGGVLYLRYWDKNMPHGAKLGNYRWQSLNHRDQDLAERQAAEMSAQFLAAGQAMVVGRITLADLFARYEQAKTNDKKGAQPAEDRRRMLLWQMELGANADVTTIGFQQIDTFVRKRRKGGIVLPERTESDHKIPRTTLRPASDTSIGADIIFLESALNWATYQRQADGSPLLASSPLRGYKRPINKNPKRPRADYDRYVKLREQADAVDPQRLFGSCLALVEALGWRISAICQLRANNVDLATDKLAPYGRIHKCGEVDKEGVDEWVPMSESARAAIDRIRSVNPTVGDAYLFPSPKPADEKMKPWSRWHARDLMERAEKAAELEPLKGGDFHPYRRKWATERKHLPTHDVMAAGGWRDPRSLEQCYQSADDETILAVVMEPKKLRAVK